MSLGGHIETFSPGSFRGIPDDDLPEGFHCHLPAQDEDIPCRILRSPKESRCIPLQHPLFGRRKTFTIRVARGRTAWVGKTI